MSFDKQHVMGAAADDQVQVTQADRDAVQAFHREMGRRLMSDIKDGTSLLDAKGEDSDPVYQAFARHRLAALEASSRQEERLREALEPFAAMRTVHESINDEQPSEWARASVERRIEMMGERKERHDANILRARAALEPPHAKDAADV